MLTDIIILKSSNCDVTFLRNAETAILRQKTGEKQNNNSCSENNYKKITTDRSYNWKLSETAPSCNDCAATIVTEQFEQTRKGIGTTCPAFLKEIRTLFPRIPESGGSRAQDSNCFIQIFSFLVMP